ncbi:MAG: hypothetical protein OXI88_06075 [Gammaproteobacteria bacterium]|nr:hypothetical protein [Gammaproteobacteria bacterium]
MNVVLITTRNSYSEPAVAGAAPIRVSATPDAAIRAAFFRFNEDKKEPMR